jgi:queuine tRNA-ribosyltransferase
MQLDECIKLPAPRAELERAMRLSLTWAERGKRAFADAGQAGALFGIVQGGDDATLRLQSACALVDIGFHGYAIGGLAVGESQRVMLRVLQDTVPALPTDRPRYHGSARRRILSRRCAQDTSLRVPPTRNGRHGLGFTPCGPVNLKMPSTPRIPARSMRKAAVRRPATIPAYLHHLLKATEMLGAILLTSVTSVIISN